MRNKEVADHLELIAQLMSLDGANKFRSKAFAEAADTIRSSDHAIEEVDAKSISGIGESVAACIGEFLISGTSDRLKDLGTRWPITAMTMTKVTGIGCKIALKFYKEHGIKSLDELYQFSLGGTLKPAMTQAIAYAMQCTMGRTPHAQAKYLADDVIHHFTENTPGVDNIMICGSLRRNTLTSKDVDIVACVDYRELAFQEFCKLGEVINVGDKKSSIRATVLGVTMQVDLWCVDPWYWGSAVLYATGSKDHCVAVRALAKSQGYVVNEYGIFKAGIDDYNEQNQIGGKEEGDIYRILGIQCVDPEYRDGTLRSL